MVSRDRATPKAIAFLLTLKIMIKKLDRFSEALQTRNPDAHIVGFFNDMYDEALENEAYLSEMEYDVLSMMLRHQEYVKERAKVIRLKMGAYRTLKQLRSCRR